MKKNYNTPKKLIILLLLLVCVFTFASCKYDVELLSDVDFKTSVFKHITNGGKDGDKPYNIDAITGATLTVEGPAVKASVPLSTKELENQNDGLVRGIYKDKSGKSIYEGIDVYYLLNEMNEGDNGIILTDTAKKVVFKDCNRETIAELSLSDIKKAHDTKEPVLIAYGVGTTDSKTIAPFVFSGANEGEHTTGYVEELDNEDGCLKLVYNYTKFKSEVKYKTFSNVAYVYVCEEKEPGYKHDETSGKDYDTSEYQDYIVTVRGKLLGYELDFTVDQLESLVQYDKKGNIVEGSMGYRDSYSLANNTYWYVNEYEGLDLYKFLQYVGMPSASEIGADAKKTFITFNASDGYTSAEKFDIATLSDPSNFGYYKKSSADLNDGTYKSTAVDLVDTGYPVLLAYGVNSYPYTIDNEGTGYKSGLSNNGGPMRVIFGKTEYGHVNGSNQIQYLSEIIVGGNVLYNTHTYTTNKEQKALAKNTVSLVVNDVDGKQITNQTVKVRDVENILYDEDATAKEKTAAQVKGLYQTKSGKTYQSDIYEGVSLEYYLMDVIGIPGVNGTVTFSDGKNEVEVDLTRVFQSGYNSDEGIDGQTAMIAFAKNGSPLVESKNSAGYVDSISLEPLSENDPAKYEIQNSGGPLAVIIPSSTASKADAITVFNVKTITVNIEPDQYAHIDEKYSALASNTIRFYGEGLNAEKTFTVSDIEGMQRKALTLDFSILNKSGKLAQERYRGVSLYDLMLDAGIKYNANEVIIYTSDGGKFTYSFSDIRKTDYVNFANSSYKENLVPLVAFGTSDISKELKVGTPLTSETGGPLKFIMPQTDAKTQNAALCLKDIVAVEVTAKEMASWGHSSSEVYSEFLSYEFEFIIKNDDSEWKHVFTLKELEDLKDCIAREEYSVLDLGLCEGIDIWKMIQTVASGVEGINDPVAVTGYASDGYSKDFLSIFYLDGVSKGVIATDGTRKPIIIGYAIKGYPIVDDEAHEGYTSLAGNTAGPLRFIAETNQGASVKYAKKLVVTIKGSGTISCNYGK